ncbi:hypothetical protein [Brucella pituitosa]|nr:hypothetical protein [Brucella pituitosa]
MHELVLARGKGPGAPHNETAQSTILFWAETKSVTITHDGVAA